MAADKHRALSYDHPEWVVSSTPRTHDGNLNTDTDARSILTQYTYDSEGLCLIGVSDHDVRPFQRVPFETAFAFAGIRSYGRERCAALWITTASPIFT